MDLVSVIFITVVLDFDLEGQSAYPVDRERGKREVESLDEIRAFARQRERLLERLTEQRQELDTWLEEHVGEAGGRFNPRPGDARPA